MAKIFAFLQILVLIAIGVAVYFRWRQSKDAEEARRFRMEGLNPHFKPKRSAAYEAEDDITEPDFSREKPVAEIGSAFPSWSKDTPLHEILEIREDATKNEIEKAYMRQLKIYHPDRFAHWGKAYQERAHYTVLMLQKARDLLLKKSKR